MIQIARRDYYGAMSQALRSEDTRIKDYVIENIPINTESHFMDLAINANDEYIILKLLRDDNVVEYIFEIIDKSPDDLIKKILVKFKDVLIKNFYITNHVLRQNKNWALELLLYSEYLDDDITTLLITFTPDEVRRVLEIHPYLNPTEKALNSAKPEILNILLDYVKSPRNFYRFESILKSSNDRKLINKIMRNIYLDEIPLPEELIEEKLRIRELLDQLSKAEEERDSFINLFATVNNPRGLSNEGSAILDVILGENANMFGRAQRELDRIGNTNFDY